MCEVWSALLFEDPHCLLNETQIPQLQTLMRTTVYYRLSLSFKTVPKASAIILSFQILILISRKSNASPRALSHTQLSQKSHQAPGVLFSVLFIIHSPSPDALESLQLCLYPSGVFLPLSVMCFAPLRCGHVFNYYPPETPLSFKETTSCHCLL